MTLAVEDAFVYFRLGLATGIVDKAEMIAWADRQIAENETFPEEIVELSLSGGRPYSEIIWLLSSFAPMPSYDLPVKLLFARVGASLSADPAGCERLVQSIRLLFAEEFLPKETRINIQAIDAPGAGPCRKALAAFLAPYEPYRALLAKTVSPEG